MIGPTAAIFVKKVLSLKWAWGDICLIIEKNDISATSAIKDITDMKVLSTTKPQHTQTRDLSVVQNVLSHLNLSTSWIDISEKYIEDTEALNIIYARVRELMGKQHFKYMDSITESDNSNKFN